jgi:hypothetical protein
MAMQRSIFLLPAFFLFFFRLSAQDEEALLTFRHPAIGNVYVASIYDSRSGQSFLPVTELFSLLEFNYKPDPGHFAITGNFLGAGNPYSIDLSAMMIKLGNDIYPLTPDDFRIGETDYFLSPKIFKNVFGLDFTVNIDYLMLSLETNLVLPVQVRLTMERNRKQAGLKKTQKDYPLLYGRKRKLISGAMFDYSITGSYQTQVQSLNYTLTGGMELLGGDIKGTLTGFHSNLGSSFRAGGLQWRYAILSNNYISTIRAGQISTTGLMPETVTGAGITNEPIEPRKMYESYIIDGTTEPESEVEIYINDQLIEYQRADEMGYYRFSVPVSYGTNRINLHILTPSGELKIVDRQMQMPFNFLPRGQVSYNLQAGQAEINPGDTLRKKYITHADVAVGATRWLTALVGFQNYGDRFISGTTYYYTSLSIRASRQILMNIDLAPGAFYRITASVLYPNDLSLNFIYTRFDGYTRFNISKARENYLVNLFLPIKIFGLNTGFRLDGEYTILENGRLARYSADYNIMFSGISLRLNYRDNFLRETKTTIFGTSLLTTSVTYTISRSPGVPVYIKGMFIRGQFMYNIRRNRPESAELKLSRTIFKFGRLNLSANYNFRFNSVGFEVGLNINLKPVRSTTTLNSTDSYYSAKQSFYGSAGVDVPNRHIGFSSRQMAGQAGASVILFVDNNGTGKYERGDELLPDKGISLDRSAVMQVGRDSILRVAPLQNYYHYNLRVNRAAIDDPTLIPLVDTFSFIADPSQYKRIEIPFYHGGLIDGMVLIEKGGKETGQGGLRLFLNGVDHEYHETIHSFTDGGFYAMDIAPGKYTLWVDPVQLVFLNVIHSDTLEIEIKALPEGDYIEGLRIKMVVGTVDEESQRSAVGGQQSAETGQNIIPDSLLIEKGQVLETKQAIAEAPGGKLYKVQLLANRQPVIMEKYFKTLLTNIPGITIAETQGDDGWFRYSTGSFNSIAKAKELLGTIKKSGWKDCFIVEDSVK